MNAPVRLHPEATADPLALRWIADTATLPEPTPAMAELLDNGTLETIEIVPGEIRTRLAAGRSWAQDGPRVRSVLFQALSAPAENALYDRVAGVIRRDVAPLVNSHGGEIRIVSLTDDSLTVSLGGACGHCTLRTNTLRNLVARSVQTEFPQIRAVRAVRA